MACPNADQHTPAPDGYIAWHSWANRMARTHTQHRCPGCGLWAIWRAKRVAPARPKGRPRKVTTPSDVAAARREEGDAP